MPDNVQQACLQELDELLAEWGAKPDSGFTQLISLWEQAADYLLQTPEVFGTEQTVFQRLCQGKSLDGYRTRLIVGGTLMHCGLYGVQMRLTEDTPLINHFANAVEYLQQNSENHESHLLIVHWVLEEFVSGIGGRQEFSALVDSLTSVLVSMAERLNQG